MVFSLWDGANGAGRSSPGCRTTLFGFLGASAATRPDLWRRNLRDVLLLTARPEPLLFISPSSSSALPLHQFFTGLSWTPSDQTPRRHQQTEFFQIPFLPFLCLFSFFFFPFFYSLLFPALSDGCGETVSQASRLGGRSLQMTL